MKHPIRLGLVCLARETFDFEAAAGVYRRITEEVRNLESVEWEIVSDGRKFERPVNYALIRIIPPAGVKVDDSKRPFIIIDPRAGHGPGRRKTGLPPGVYSHRRFVYLAEKDFTQGLGVNGEPRRSCGLD